MQQLEQRVMKLERSLKYYRLFFTVIVIGTFSVILMSSGNKYNVPELVQAKTFEVVDNNGKVIAKFGQEKGNGTLTTYSGAGNKLVSLITTEGGAGGINTFDDRGQLTFKVTNTKGGGGYFALYNDQQKEVVEYGVTNASSGYFRVNDRYGDKLAWLTYVEGGGGYFSLSNNGEETLSLAASGGGGRISAYNKKNKRIAYMGSQDSQDGNLTIFNSDGTISGSIPK